MPPTSLVTKVVARESLPGRGVVKGDHLDGVWNLDWQCFEWAGTLAEGETLDVMIHHVVVEALYPEIELVGSVVDSPITLEKWR